MVRLRCLKDADEPFKNLSISNDLTTEEWELIKKQVEMANNIYLLHLQGERPPMEPENSMVGGQSLSHKTNEHKKPVHNNTTFGLNCIYLNADSLLNKRDELKAVVSQTEPDIIAITEVLPKNTRTPVQPSELRLEGYNLFWNSNPRRGVCIYSKSSLKCDEVDINVDGAQESVWISTQLAGQDKLLIGCMYLSPNSNADNEDKIRQTLQKASDSKYSHLLITGDFNQPDIDWTNCTSPQVSEHRATKFLDKIRDCYLFQHVTQPTHHRGEQQANFLDLSFTNEMDMIEEVHHKPPLGKSHHSRLEFMYRCYHVQKINDRRKFMYDKGDYNRIRTEHGNINWNAKLSGMNTQETWLTIEKYINDLCTKHKSFIYIPTKAVHSTARRRRPVWMNDCMFRKLKKKSEAYSRYLQTKEDKDYQEYCKTRNQAKREVRRAKNCFEKQLGEQAKTNPKAFYNYCNLKRKTKAGIAGLKREDGTTAEDDQEKTEMLLNNFFSSVYTKEDFTNVPSMEPRNNGHYLDNIIITEATVAKKLSQLNAAKSPGLDGIHPRILKELSSVLSKPITILYKRTLEEMKLPTEWKEGLVTPIFKKGRKSSLENYRPHGGAFINMPTWFHERQVVHHTAPRDTRHVDWNIRQRRSGRRNLPGFC